MKKVYILAAIMAVVVGIAVYLFASSLEHEARAGADEKGQAVVAVKKIPANTQIAGDMVKTVQLPAGSINAVAAAELSQVVGKIARYPLLPGEQILLPRLAEKGNEGGALSYALEEGYRAISVAVNDVTGVSGYINRGDRVDVVATLVAYDATKKNQPVSTLIAQNLLVLETGTKWKKPTDSASDGYATVTLAATPQEALKINYAATNGKLGLVLRPVLDNEKVTTKNYP